MAPFMPNCALKRTADTAVPDKIPYKSPALPDFYAAARAVAARLPLLCKGEGVIPNGFP